MTPLDRNEALFLSCASADFLSAMAALFRQNLFTTQTEAQRRTGFSASYVHQIENRHKILDIPLVRIWQIFSMYNCPVELASVRPNINHVANLSHLFFSKWAATMKVGRHVDVSFMNRRENVSQYIPRNLDFAENTARPQIYPYMERFAGVGDIQVQKQYAYRAYHLEKGLPYTSHALQTLCGDATLLSLTLREAQEFANYYGAFVTFAPKEN